MAITINGAGTITGLSTGGLPDGSINTSDLADSAVTNAKIDSLASSKLTGALPAIDGSALTGISSSGKVLQVVQSTGSTTFSSTASSFTSTPQTITITPTSSTSTIYVQMVNAIWSASSQYTHLEIRASGGASGVISSWGDWYSGYYGNTPIPGWHTGHNTTSAITYTLYGRSDGATWYAPNNNSDTDIDNRYMSVAWELEL